MNDTATNSLSQDQLDRLSAILDQYSEQDSLSLEALDGFFSALIASPVIVAPTDYLPVVFGGGIGESSVLDNVTEKDEALALLTQHWDSIVAAVESEDGPSPVIFEGAEDGVLGREWAIGFLIGMDFAPERWDELFSAEEADAETEGEEALMPSIPLVAGASDPEWPQTPLSEEEADDLVATMAAAFMLAYDSFREARDAAKADAAQA
jgi:yecA family protein